MRASILVVSMSGGLLFASRPAQACGPPAPPPSEPACEFVQLYIPADQFPRQLEGAIRIGTFDKQDGVLFPQSTFDPNVQIFVHRATAAGYEPVAFQLVMQNGLVPNALHLQLADPAPGQYIISSPQMTCAADPSPAGTGLLVGSFELAPDAALPTSLGELHWAGEQTVEEGFRVGPDGACRYTDVTAGVTHSKLELRLAADALPWANVLDASIYVDGELYRGSSPLQSEQGVATIDLTRICSSSDPTLVATQPGFDGMHTVKLVGRIEGLAVLDSTETTFSLGCEDSGWFSGGCAVGGDERQAFVPLLAWLAIAARRRRAKA
ncbi:MAG TPA: hypothetical protein VLB44_09710 [Kofleriaceae bacterium]|nr:hypothetical protein [Kofleriaceae bacterium]